VSAVKKINHVALVVDDIDSALSFWRDSLGVKPNQLAEVREEASKIAFMPVGDSEIELVQPTTEDSGIARYLRQRGPGMHHLCLEVDDIQQMITKLIGNGIELINPEPSIGEDGRQYVFIHPRSAHGVLVELYQLPPAVSA
jgi:methylmalonyl-CoA/ethylmalonyl-CoA epimerase